MKKFSSTEEKEKKVYEPTFNKTIKRLIKDCLSIKSNDENMILGNAKIEGEEQLISSIIELINSEKKDSFEMVNETATLQSIHYVDLMKFDNVISNLKEQLSEIEMSPSPEDIFCSEDYVLDKEGNIVLKSLNNVPQDYFSDVIKSEQANKYFENGNTVTVNQTEDGKQWNIKFDFNKNNYLDKDEFLKEEKEFITDFLESAQRLVGPNKINLFS
jgi:hypothetical protein